MATHAQINANRLNAQHSTGPRTESGRANSARNHLTLGLYTQLDYVKPGEQDLYDYFCRTMYLELAPSGLLESSLAEEITSATWRLRRCNAAEAELGDYCDDTDRTRRSIERARAASHSVLHRTLNQLRKLKKERVPKPACIPDPRLSPEEQAIAAIMNCPEPDWSAIDLSGSVASNCETARPYRHEGGIEDVLPGSLASNCKPAPQTPRNAPCPCRSGEKFKRCCGKNSPPVLGKAA
jgi:hypothetical protein